MEAAPPPGPTGAGGRRRAGHEVSEGGREKSEREKESGWERDKGEGEVVAGEVVERRSGLTHGVISFFFLYRV